MKMEDTGCSETSAYKIQTPGNYPEENIQHSDHGENLKSEIHFIKYDYILSCLIIYMSTFLEFIKIHTWKHVQFLNPKSFLIYAKR